MNIVQKTDISSCYVIPWLYAKILDGAATQRLKMLLRKFVQCTLFNLFTLFIYFTLIYKDFL
jgi:hypothetical protein